MFDCRSFLVDTDWTQSAKREGTFLLDTTERPSSTPAHIRSTTPLSRRTPADLRSSQSRIPLVNNKQETNGDINHVNHGSEELIAAINKVEDTISPLARANSEIQESLVTLERSLMVLKNISNKPPDRK